MKCVCVCENSDQSIETQICIWFVVFGKITLHTLLLVIANTKQSSNEICVEKFHFWGVFFFFFFPLYNVVR